MTALLHARRHLKIAVIGDSVAGDLSRGLVRILSRSHSRHEIVNFTKPATGLMRTDVYNWPRVLKHFVATTRFDIAVVMIGGNDRQSVWMKGHRLELGTEAWHAEYERRVANFMDIVAASKAKVYWVGLPIVRSARMDRDYRLFNRIYRSQARRHGFTFIDTWAAFADGKGHYTSFGRDLEGVKRRLRQRDGKHFSMSGEDSLANLAVRAIAQDFGNIERRR